MVGDNEAAVEMKADDLAAMVAFVQTWMAKFAVQAGADEISPALMDVVSAACAKNLHLEEDAFVAEVSRQRGDAASAQDSSGCGSCESCSDSEGCDGCDGCTYANEEMTFLDAWTDVSAGSWTPADWDAWDDED